MGRTVTPLSYDFAGSNPALPTKILRNKIAGVAQLVERQPSKLNVAGSNPVSRSKKPKQMFRFFILYILRYLLSFNLSPKKNNPTIINAIIPTIIV